MNKENTAFLRYASVAPDKDQADKIREALSKKFNNPDLKLEVIKDKKITIPVNKNNIKELTEEFKEKLKAVLEQLFDINQEFKAKESPNCRYCNFQNFCQGI